MEILKVKGNTYVIDTGITYIPFYKINGEEIIMLDSGWSIMERQGIAEILEKNNFKATGIICSHAHRDHVGNNSFLKNKYDSIIAMPAYEAEVCSSLQILRAYYGIQTLAEAEKHLGEMICETDIRILDDQDEIYLRSIRFGILHTPGHSPAHIGIITPDDVAYLGDALISHEVIKTSKMPYVFMLKEDLKSKAKLYSLRHSKYIVAHKGVYEDITKLTTDNIAFYKSIAEKICDIIACPMTMDEILEKVYSSFRIYQRKGFKDNIIERIVTSNIRYLIEERRIKQVDEKWQPYHL
jgi:hydroxyacylglutathione hydrolase